LKILEEIAKKIIKVNKEIERRAKYFESLGIQAFDALHLACAEMEADILLTVDKRFLKKSKEDKRLKNRSKKSIRVDRRGVLWEK